MKQQQVIHIKNEAKHTIASFYPIMDKQKVVALMSVQLSSGLSQEDIEDANKTAQLLGTALESISKDDEGEGSGLETLGI